MLKHPILFFSTMPDFYRVMLLIFSMSLFQTIEFFKAIIRKYSRTKHLLFNASFVLTAIPAQYFLGIALLYVMKFDSTNNFGLLYHLKLSFHPFLITIIAFVLLDLGEYIYHLIMHKSRKLFPFHAVHHSDRVVDIATTLREHPGETLVRLSFLVLWVFVLGVPFWVLMIRQVIQIVSNTLAHANFSIPAKLDNLISWLLVTPNFHHLHHHEKQPLTDKNYGDVLTIWDRLFGTFETPEGKVFQYGIDKYIKPKESKNIKSLLLVPFKQLYSRL